MVSIPTTVEPAQSSEMQIENDRRVSKFREPGSSRPYITPAVYAWSSC